MQSGGSQAKCLGLANNGNGPQVVIDSTCAKASAQWVPAALEAGGWSQFKSKDLTNMCLTSDGQAVPEYADPWCLANNNMWRSNTDVLQQWGRTMMEVESLATQGTISRPGAWSFPDCTAIGVAGQGSFTWNEARSVLALFAVTSSPIILGNDPRPLQMQQRLVDLFVNKDMIQVDQQYHAGHAYAGGRIWSGPGGQEIWVGADSAGSALAGLVASGLLDALCPCRAHLLTASSIHCLWQGLLHPAL